MRTEAHWSRCAALGDSKLHDRTHIVGQNDALSSMSGEINNEISALSRRNDHVIQRDWRRQKPQVGSDLVERLRFEESQMKETRIGRIQHTEAILAGLDIQIWK